VRTTPQTRFAGLAHYQASAARGHAPLAPVLGAEAADLLESRRVAHLPRNRPTVRRPFAFTACSTNLPRTYARDTCGSDPGTGDLTP